jgi:hypothetical protein
MVDNKYYSSYFVLLDEQMKFEGIFNLDDLYYKYAGVENRKDRRQYIFYEIGHVTRGKSK